MADSGAYVTSPTDEDLRVGCIHKARTMLWIGFGIGFLGSFAYSGTQAIRYGLHGREFVRKVGYFSFNTGTNLAIVGLLGQLFFCY